MEAAALASLARKLEALDYVVPAEGLPACSGPLLEQVRALLGIAAAAAHGVACRVLRRAAALRLRRAFSEAHVLVFRKTLSCFATWCTPRTATGRSSSAPPSRLTSWRRGATRRDPAAAPHARRSYANMAQALAAGELSRRPAAARALT